MHLHVRGRIAIASYRGRSRMFKKSNGNASLSELRDSSVCLSASPAEQLTEACIKSSNGFLKLGVVTSFVCHVAGLHRLCVMSSIGERTHHRVSMQASGSIACTYRCRYVGSAAVHELQWSAPRYQSRVFLK